MAGEELRTGQGPIGRARRYGLIERSDFLKTDPTTASWLSMFDKLGWGSSAAVPLVDRSGRTRALMSLQASWTGFFATEARQVLLQQIKHVAEEALTELEQRPNIPPVSGPSRTAPPTSRCWRRGRSRWSSNRSSTSPAVG